MQVELTSDQRAFAQRAVEAGRLKSEDDAVREAMALWEERERRRVEFLATVHEARTSLLRGDGREITPESMRELSAEVKERGRARLANFEEWSTEFEKWSEGHDPSTPLLPDEALERESIYGTRSS